MSKAKCPMCNSFVNVPGNGKEGDLVYCDSCNAELEIVSLKPLELDWPLGEFEYEGGYDGYEYEDDEYDDYDD